MKTQVAPNAVRYGSLSVDPLNSAYREAGDPASPKLILLHGFPASSHQDRDLIPALVDSFHAIAPDYPGFGNSDMPDPATFAYRFDKISEAVEAFLKQKGFDRYGLYGQDYAGPAGFRIVGRHPEALEWLIIQNSNAYDVGPTAAWDRLRGAMCGGRFSASGNPETIIFWGQDDIFFTREGGDAYVKDLPHAELHRLNSGHFAVEDCLAEISSNMRRFYREQVAVHVKESSVKHGD
jgi:pimeloyl-ACP methyl ester carboxylesterase